MNENEHKPDEAIQLLERIVGIVDLLLATGSDSLPIRMNPPPLWLCDAREMLERRNA